MNSKKIGLLMTAMILVSGSTFANAVNKISYNCKGNTITHIGDKIVPDMEDGGKFKISVKGFTAGMNLKIGPDVNNPDFDIIPLAKNTVKIKVNGNIPLMLNGSGAMTYVIGDMKMDLKPPLQSGLMVRILKSEIGLKVVIGDLVNMMLLNYTGPMEILAKDGRFEFRTSDDRHLKCSINID